MSLTADLKAAARDVQGAFTRRQQEAVSRLLDIIDAMPDDPESNCAHEAELRSAIGSLDDARSQLREAEAAGFARGIEAAAQHIGAPRNYKLNDGKSDIGNAARAKAAEEIRALAPPDAATPSEPLAKVKP